MRYQRSLPVAILLAVLTCGCTPSLPKQADVEEKVLAKMKAELGVDIEVIELKAKEDGSFRGTATTEAGVVYGVTWKDGGSYWQADPGLQAAEQIVRADVVRQLTMLELTKRGTAYQRKERMVQIDSLEFEMKGPGIYGGTAQLGTGQKISVTAGFDGATFRATNSPHILGEWPEQMPFTRPVLSEPPR